MSGTVVYGGWRDVGEVWRLRMLFDNVSSKDGMWELVAQNIQPKGKCTAPHERTSAPGSRVSTPPLFCYDKATASTVGRWPLKGTKQNRVIRRVSPRVLRNVVR